MKSEWSMVNGQWSMLFRRGSILACLLVCTNLLFAQKITTILSKDKIVIGEQVTLKIAIDGITSSQVQQDFYFPDTVNNLEVISDSVDADGPGYIHTLTITSFDSGHWQFPSYEILLSGNRKLVSQAVNITVLPVDISNMADYHDIKDILETDPENNWWIIASIVLLGLLSLFAFLWFATNKTEQQQGSITDVDLHTLYNRFSKELEKMETFGSKDPALLPGLFTLITQHTRSFIDAAYKKNTAHLTSGEYMLQLKGNLPDAETANEYFQFLRFADAVKFAKYNPPDEDIRSVFPTIRKVAKEVYEQNKQKN